MNNNDNIRNKNNKNVLIKLKYSTILNMIFDPIIENIIKKII